MHTKIVDFTIECPGWSWNNGTWDQMKGTGQFSLHGSEKQNKNKLCRYFDAKF